MMIPLHWGIFFLLFHLSNYNTSPSQLCMNKVRVEHQWWVGWAEEGSHFRDDHTKEIRCNFSAGNTVTGAMRQTGVCGGRASFFCLMGPISLQE